MYKFLLCLRYLRTRYIALASIISVTLGVATMIVVNSVMEGFTTEMQDRIHGILSDVTVESRSLSGMPDPDWHIERIREVGGDDIKYVTPIVKVPGMLNIPYGGDYISRQVQVVGIDTNSHAAVSDFGKYLQHPENRREMSFELREGGYDTHDHQAGPDSPERTDMRNAGWVHRRRAAEHRAFQERFGRRQVGVEREPNDVYAAKHESDANDTGDAIRDGQLREVDYREELLPVPSTTASTGSMESAPRLVEPSDAQIAIDTASTSVTISASDPKVLTPLPEHTLVAADAPIGKSPLPGEHGLKDNAPETATVAPLGDGSGAVTKLGDIPDDSYAMPASSEEAAPADPFLVPTEPNPPETNTPMFDTAPFTGIVLGIANVAFRDMTDEGDVEERFLAIPGDDVKLTVPNTGKPPEGCSASFTIVDLYESKMSEYDSTLVFVPIEKLQEMRGMFEPETGMSFVNSIQIKLNEGADGDAVRDRLRAAFPKTQYVVSTWRDQQGPLLAAVQMETAILNVLLFLIIAVAGFGILAIFLMIVVEKTRDIGILKSLGASSKGVMGIFLAYGLSLGLVGSGVGLVLGLLFVSYINEIADLLGRITGQPVFNPEIYYFYEIPTIKDPVTISWIVVGALVIAVLASVLPALRAAMLHPVEALRYE